MDFKGAEEKDQMKSRSFRYEDYNNRRAFLRSYPLFWGGGEDENRKEATEKAKVEAANGTNSKKYMKKMILAVFHWGGERIIIFRRFKHKVTVYVITCLPVGLRTPTALISA